MPPDDDFRYGGPLSAPPQAPAWPRGTILHKGFYDLLSVIPTPSASVFWRAPNVNVEDPALLAGPPYHQLPNSNAHTPPRKPRTPISKDMVSKPTGFVHLVHASDADQAEILLRRWGPDGMGKLGDPRWADPIKKIVRQKAAQARAVAQVVTAMRDDPASRFRDPPLRVINATLSSTGATMNHSTDEDVEGLPGARPSALRWGGLSTHAEEAQDGGGAQEQSLQGLPQVQLPQGHPQSPTVTQAPGLPHPQSPTQRQPPPVPAAIHTRPLPSPPKKPITPSLTTLEKAVATRIYFENIYFPLLRHPPSRDQRLHALERDLNSLSVPESHKAEIRERWRRNETEYLREKRRRVDARSFVKLKTIGHGAFGVVSLVREQGTGSLFAMKQLRKVDMLRKGQEGHVRAERDVLKSAALIGGTASDWIVKLFYSFQDRDHLYLVLEFMGGGDLLNLLIERDVFEEDFTRFYVAEMVLAIEQCHKHGFIHRDIKPDNFLFDPDGHIKLSDFGLATDLHWAHDTSYYDQQRKDLLRKHGIDLEDGSGFGDPKPYLPSGSATRKMNKGEVERIMGSGPGGAEGGVFTWREKNRKKLAYSVCGTNSYMSPEVIRGHGYTFSCDWWSLGVIMFECLFGYPPFVSNSRHVTRQKILNWKQSLRFPARPRVSSEGVDLMKQLLCEPEDRLGSQAPSSVSRPNSMIMQARRSGFVNAYTGHGSVDGAELIKAHPWFVGIDWENIRQYPAPFKPDLEHPEDTRHFDGDIPAEPLPPANGAAADATRDPMLRHKVHGQHILEVRKALAFAGFTHKSPRAIEYSRPTVHEIYANMEEADRGRQMHMATVREGRRESTMKRGRALSL
ncbi:hypothetical protein M422DRAFT_27790 [Sphaerobolus stellatus SS14]|nr:hypothetical protein M422DRAFT_27790 [Sphaerobolus stellatus SS14]